MNFQQLVLSLQSYWAQQGCIIGQPYDVEKGAGTFNPHTFLRTLGPEPWKVAYVEPCRRPTDGRYGENPNRLGAYYQFQVILKPSPKDVIERYLRGLTALGIHPREHDIRFVEDDWESPTLGAWGLGWEVWLDGMEITQFTYFQQVGGVECRPVSAEITYGLERIAMYLQKVDNVFDLEWAHGVSYREIHHHTEVDWSKYNFEHADPAVLFGLFKTHEGEAQRLAELGLVFPAYDEAQRCSHIFNTLDARGAISVAERAAYIGRIRNLARRCAETFVAEREKLDYPILRGTSVWNRPDSEQATLDGELAALSTLPPGATHGETPTGSMETLSNDLPDADPEATVVATLAPAGGRAELLIELGVEEIPARFLPLGERELANRVAGLLDAHEIPHGGVRTCSTPRRVALVIEDVADRAPVGEETVTGPPTRVALDGDGKPRVPGLKFAEKMGVPFEQLIKLDTPKGEYLGFVRATGGEETIELLEEELPGILAALPWPKSMRWGSRDERFVRPLHWIVAVYGTQQIRFAFAGVEAGNLTWGHRFFGHEQFPVWDFDSLNEGLGRRNVQIDPMIRRRIVEAQLREAADERGGRVVRDGALLDSVVGLVEFPKVIAGSFDERYLQLPREVVATILTYHQKMFVLEDAETGGLLPWFLGVSNNPSDEQPLVRQGYEKVVSARLADGDFFFGTDRKRSLLTWGEGLGGIRFLAGMGTMGDKADRLVSLAESLADSVPGADGAQTARAARLCKADLCSHVVGEFPELQGVMGRIYARADGEDEAVSEAIFEHYLPRGADDELPQSPAGIACALADRLDTLAACFAVGKQPTGSADPYALRRAALGVLRIVAEHKLRVSLDELVQRAVAALPEHVSAEVRGRITGELVDFFRGRLKGLLTSEGAPTDLAEAALGAGFTDVADVQARITALVELRRSDAWADLMASFKRMANIVRKSGGKVDLAGELDRALLDDGAERALFEAFVALREASDEAIAQQDYPGSLQHMSALRQPLATFFDDVLVNAKDEAVRANRLRLLHQIGTTFARIADFSRISTE